MLSPLKVRRAPGDDGNPRHHRTQEIRGASREDVAELKRSNDDSSNCLRLIARSPGTAAHGGQFYSAPSQALQRRLDPDADEFIAFAVDGCNRMQGLIHDLLTYSRAGATERLFAVFSVRTHCRGRSRIYE